MAIETVNIVGRSDIITAKQSKKQYFTVTDDTDRKLICFNPHLHEKLDIGSVVQLETKPGLKEGDTIRIERLVDDEETQPHPVEEQAEPAPQERGMCLKEIGEGIRSGQLAKDFPNSVVRIKSEYYNKISNGSGINFWKEQE